MWSSSFRQQQISWDNRIFCADEHLSVYLACRFQKPFCMYIWQLPKTWKLLTAPKGCRTCAWSPISVHVPIRLLGSRLATIRRGLIALVLGFSPHPGISCARIAADAASAVRNIFRCRMGRENDVMSSTQQCFASNVPMCSICKLKRLPALL